jgi:hypothetical protein
MNEEWLEIRWGHTVDQKWLRCKGRLVCPSHSKSNQANLLLHFRRYVLQLFQTTVYCPLNHFGVFLFVSSSSHNLTQAFLSNVHFSSMCHLRNWVGLGPEILATKLLDRDNQSIDIVVLIQVSQTLPKCGSSLSSWKKIPCLVSLKVAVYYSESSDNYQQ